MKSKKLIFVLLMGLLTSFCNAQDASHKFKIIGYYPLDKAMKVDTAKVRYDQLTHIDLAFVNPDSSGNFHQNFAELESFIEGAHRNSVKVLFSIGGGAYQGQYHALLKRDKRSGLIERLVSKVLNYDIDGVDVDLESGYAFGAKTDSNYGAFVVELARSLRTHGKLITAALPASPGKVVTQKVLAQFDFINIMSYDHTGPWSPKRKFNHASYSDAMDDLDHYRNKLNIPGKRLVLSVPFYGHGFGPNLTSPVIGWMPYKEIISTYAGAEWVDHWHLPNGYIMYYNGITTIKNKTKLAKQKGAGIMVWQLRYDTQGPKSLLKAINQEAY